MRTVLTLAATALAGSALAACGGSATGTGLPAASRIAASLSQAIADATGGPTPSDPSDPSSGGEGAASQVNLRVANMFVADGHKPGPALDIYDVQLTGQAATPILTGVAYGSFSAYVHPHLNGGSTSDPIYLEALPSGEDPTTGSADAKAFTEVVDDGSHPQITYLLTGSGGALEASGPLDGLGTATYVEKGDTADGGSPEPGQDAGPLAPAPPAGQGELLVSTSVLDENDLHGDGYYLRIGSSCTEPLNHAPSATGLPDIFAADGVAPTQFALFPATAGTHQVSVVSWSSGITPTCAQLTAAQGTTTVTTTAGQQSLVLVYGTSLTGLHLAVGPIAP